MFHEIDNISWNIPILFSMFISNVGISRNLCGILSILLNIVMDLNNVMKEPI